eukprot:65341-Chlamydomonas_euryale.AAC.1
MVGVALTSPTARARHRLAITPDDDAVLCPPPFTPCPLTCPETSAVQGSRYSGCVALEWERKQGMRA